MDERACVVSAHAAVSALGAGSSRLESALLRSESAISSPVGRFVPSGFPVGSAAILDVPGQKSESGRFFDENSKHRWRTVLTQLLEDLRPGLRGVSKVDAIFYSHRHSQMKINWSGEGGSWFLTLKEVEALVLERLAEFGVALADPSQFIFVENTCVTGASSIGFALDQFRKKEWSTVLVLGVDLSSRTGLWGLSALNALSRYEGEPRRSSRPFSRSRTGFVKAEAAAAILLEDGAQAKLRGARPSLSILGWAQSSDGSTLTAGRDDSQGLIECMSACLEDSRISAQDVDLIKAHGTGTPLNDLHEATAIHRVFGERAGSVPVISFKGQFGHMTNVAGVFELILCETVMRTRTLYPSLNCEDLDETLGLNVIRERTAAPGLKTILFNTSGFGGHNCTYAIGRAPA